MTEREVIERLMHKAEEVRRAQAYYFKNRNDVNKRLSIAKEQDLDNYLKELRRLGFTPENAVDKIKQPKLF